MYQVYFEILHELVLNMVKINNIAADIFNYMSRSCFIYAEKGVLKYWLAIRAYLIKANTTETNISTFAAGLPYHVRTRDPLIHTFKRAFNIITGL